MALAQSKVTAQGQISIPAQVRKRLGIGPGSVLSWEEEEEGRIVVKKVGKYTALEIHQMLFPDGPPEYRTDEELKEGIAQSIREKFARR